MAYDFGSQTLGIKNPFKIEGRFRSATGAIIFVAGFIPLLQVSKLLRTEPTIAYTYAVLGFILLAAGGRYVGVGLFQLFRYFVGRSVPTSLAFNKSISERESAQAESAALLYDAQKLHSMLMGRKNLTFIEPQGWVARLIHSLFKNLTFLPFPLRQLGQELGSMALNFLTAIISFLLILFIVKSGLAGDVAKAVAMPIISIILLIYLVVTWRKAAKTIGNSTTIQLSSTGGASFSTLIAMSIMLPIFFGFAFESLLNINTNQAQQYANELQLFSATENLIYLFIAIVMVMSVVLPVLIKRSRAVTPSTDVSEYRDNFQENVHPNEIFINIENIVLANRRYKEIPNRVYREFDPQLDEQAEGKGSFNGELLIETQPQVNIDDGTMPSNKSKMLVSLVAMVSVLVSYIWLAILILAIGDFVQYIPSMRSNLGVYEGWVELSPQISGILTALFGWLTFNTASRLLNNASHLFWGELQFSSLLMHMRTEGTFTESKISTGMSIHDSTRSENVVVRSSITPWLITSRIKTSIFATSGSNNLEAPRFVMGMSKNDEELNSIVDEIKSFLRGRESIASITNEADLNNASTFHQVNEQTRALVGDSDQQLSKDEQAAGYLRGQE